ncbi:hypothetical protein [Pantoea dispersa]|uniref:hypothetical protein n=1 Tax=Pantoea dispersa TaxID=59814 RepID=UPI001331349C|nr:hypothetical protein [Pantoea dispersa]KAF0855972.1 hypothetical protein Y788_05695 [Pantoea dispersa 625]
MKLIIKNIILFSSIMTGFLFLSGAGIFPGFNTFKPPVELSRLVITISSLISFVLLGGKIIKILFKDDIKAHGNIK